MYLDNSMEFDPPSLCEMDIYQTYTMNTYHNQLSIITKKSIHKYISSHLPNRIHFKAGRGPARVQLNKEVKHQTEAVPYPYKNWIVIYDASIISGSVSFLTH